MDYRKLPAPKKGLDLTLVITLMNDVVVRVAYFCRDGARRYLESLGDMLASFKVELLIPT